MDSPEYLSLIIPGRKKWRFFAINPDWVHLH